MADERNRLCAHDVGETELVLIISKNWIQSREPGTKDNMIAVIGNLVVALLVISLFTATLRLSK